MGYIVLALGVALWAGAHLFKRVMPAQRAALGAQQGRLAVTLALVAAIVVMVMGYRWAQPVWLWNPPAWTAHLNNLLMFLAVYLFAVSGMGTALARRIRHPQLTAVKTWAVAHLLVAGTVQALVLFGGLLAWAVVSVIVINRAEGGWTPPPEAPLWKEGVALVAAVFATLVIGIIHGWVGPWPFGG